MSYEIVSKESSNRILPENSRYRRFDVIKDSNGDRFLESWRKIEIRETENDSFHEIQTKEENRLDLIANQYYDNHKFWWIIALANNLNNPFDLEVGEVLRIPSLEAIYGYEGVFS